MGSFDLSRQRVVETARLLVEKDYFKGTGGNLSVRVEGQPAFAITPSNYDYLKMLPEDVCVLDWQTNVLEGTRKPSIESGLHAAVYQVRADVNVIIHSHQLYASTLALIDAPIPALFDEQVRYLGRSVEIVPYAPSGTGALMKNVQAKVRNGHNAYILKNHGAVVLGTDAERAIQNLELLEKCALAYLLALCTERRVTRIPLAIREIVFAKLRKDEEKFARLNQNVG
ncbi:MAG TPA: class II aldolase/adducin family protein [Anaerolineae bacterium]|nr:class II aldolase/adducin family protein [Anaerolineae bacterium]HQI86338.1 class II aldolase/adducin family protein [Anaerolineae bacterium]